MTTSLGDLQQLSMLAVARLGSEAFGSTIREELSKVGHRKVSIATVYVTLVRLEEQGLVRSHRSADARAGRPRRYFEVTRRGWTALRASRESLARMWSGLEETGA